MNVMREHSVLLLGATGTLGSILASALSHNFVVVAPIPLSSAIVPETSAVTWLTTTLDAMNPEGLDRLIVESESTAIINCIAALPRPGTPFDEVTCVAVNSLFPHRLAEAARRHGRRLIHFSTDGVFSGRSGNYSEMDLPDPLDLYGRSKLAGEVQGDGCLTLRTTFFGRTTTGRGLVEWLLLHRGMRVDGFVNYVFTGLSAGALSHAMIAAIAHERPLEGIYHLGGPPVSKYALLKMLSDELRLGITIDPIAEPRVNRSLNSSRFWTAIQEEPPSMEQMVKSV
jgi:dTDP-4-dehydrorhamnose reductase